MSIKKILILFLVWCSSSVYAQEYPHPNNSYNTALEYYQREDLGRAMFYTKRAILLKPADNTIRTLFFDIRQDIGLPQIYSTDGLGRKFLGVFFGQLSPHINAFIGGSLFLLGAIVVSMLLLSKLKKSNILIISIWILFICSSILFIQASIQYYMFFLPDQRVVITQTKAYEEPSLEGRYLLDLPAGTEITVVVQQNNQETPFYLVRTLDGKEYWVKPDSIPKLWEDL